MKRERERETKGDSLARTMDGGGIAGGEGRRKVEDKKSTSVAIGRGE
jgi:hypothetical protein